MKTHKKIQPKLKLTPNSIPKMKTAAGRAHLLKYGITDDMIPDDDISLDFFEKHRSNPVFESNIVMFMIDVEHSDLAPDNISYIHMRNLCKLFCKSELMHWSRKKNEQNAPSIKTTNTRLYAILSDEGEAFQIIIDGFKLLLATPGCLRMNQHVFCTIKDAMYWIVPYFRSFGCNFMHLFSTNRNGRFGFQLSKIVFSYMMKCFFSHLVHHLDYETDDADLNPWNRDNDAGYEIRMSALEQLGPISAAEGLARHTRRLTRDVIRPSHNGMFDVSSDEENEVSPIVQNGPLVNVNTSEEESADDSV